MKKKLIIAGAIIIGLWILVKMMPPKNQPERNLELGVMPIITPKEVHFSREQANDILQPLEKIHQDAMKKIEAYR